MVKSLRGVGGGKSELTHEPCDDGRLPEPIVVKKYRTTVLANNKDSTRHGAHFLRSTRSSESGSRVPGGDDSTENSKIQDPSADSKYFIPMPTANSSTRTSRHRAQGSPAKTAASRPAPPSPEQGTPNTSQGLDYRQSLNCDEYYQTGSEDQFSEKTSFSENLSFQPEADCSEGSLTDLIEEHAILRNPAPLPLRFCIYPRGNRGKERYSCL